MTARISRAARAYLECVLWSSTDGSRDDGGDPLDANYALVDFAPETLARACREVDAWVAAHAEDLADWDDEQAGHDLWLTQVGHGTGFWDRSLGTREARERLTADARSLGRGAFAYVVGDGQVHIDGWGEP